MKKIRKIAIIIMLLLLSGAASAEISRTWTVFEGGKPALLTSDDDLAIYQIMFFTALDQNNSAITIKHTPGEGIIYQTINITKRNMNDDLLSAGTIKLKIKNEWLDKYIPNGSSVIFTTPTGGYFEHSLLFSRKGNDYSYYQGSIKDLKSFIITTNSKAILTQTVTETKSESPKETAAPATETASCADGRKNQDETDIDCGGSACGKCATERSCSFNSDCEGDFCYQGICRVPNCGDGIKNQDESDADCGGSSCGKCGLSQRCNSNNDCQSGYCTQGYCREIPAAKNEVKTASSSTPKFTLPELDFKVSDSTKESIKKNAPYVIGGIVLIVIIVLSAKLFGGKKKEPSVDDLMKLYEQIKRI